MLHGIPSFKATYLPGTVGCVYVGVYERHAKDIHCNIATP